MTINLKNIPPHWLGSLLKLSMLGWLLLTIARVTAGENLPAWQEDTSDDGQIQVLHRFTQKPNFDTGQPEPTLDYRMTYIGRFDLETALAQLEDFQKLKIIEGADHAEELKQTSDNQRLVYFSSERQWIISGSDVVARMTKTVNESGDQVTITFTSEPSAMEPTDKKRFIRYFVRYTLNELSGGNLKVTIEGEKTPPFKVPKWLIKTALPSAAFEQMERFIELIEEDNSTR